MEVAAPFFGCIGVGEVGGVIQGVDEFEAVVKDGEGDAGGGGLAVESVRQWDCEKL